MSAEQEPVNWTGILIGYVLGAIAWVACFVIAVQFGKEPWLNLLICFFGSVVGWSAGMLLTPTPGEKEEFLGFRRAISALLSGFLLAKVEGLLRAPLNGDWTVPGRLLLFGTTFLICLQFTYVGRAYRDKDKLATRPNLQWRSAQLKAWERWTRIFALALLLFVGAGYVYVTFLRSLPPLLTWLIAGAAVAVIALLASVGRVREVILGTTRSTATAAESPGT